LDFSKIELTKTIIKGVKMFTKRHFIKIAEMLKNERLGLLHLSDDDVFGSQDSFLGLVDSIENQLIKIFKEENPRFDVDKFRWASNPSPAERKLAI
tara:strand:+ start:177 stop:464 length:288 start_codon:yes stop_codon:yes gene_type:complete